MRSKFMLLVLCLAMAAALVPTETQAGFFDFLFHRKPNPLPAKERIQQWQAAQKAKQKKPPPPKKYLFQQ